MVGKRRQLPILPFVDTHTATSFPAIEILGVRIACLTRADALDQMHRLVVGEGAAHAAFVNAHSLNTASRDLAYRSVLDRADIVLNDGSGVALAARMRGRRFPANLNGSDFTRDLLGLAARSGWPVYFLGGRPGIAETAARRLAVEIAGLDVVGVRDGYMRPEEEAVVAAQVRDSGAVVLLVAMGNPLQELWIDRHLEATGARLALGVGAFFDFSAGEVRRAPAWMNRMGIEWLHRLALEPRRLWRRYVLGNPEFVARALWDAVVRR